MLDIRVIRENPERVKAAMKTRNKDMDALVDEVLAIDAERREITSKTDALKAEQNNASREIPRIKRIVKEEDPAAFLFITDTHETLGEGFAKLR